MSLSPTIRQDAKNDWWMDWKSDPNAVAYHIITEHGRALAGPQKTTARLGTVKPTVMPKIAPANAGVYETAVDPSAVPSLNEGRVKTVFKTGSDTDALLNGFDDTKWAWARDHWDRMYAFPPYSDRWMGKMPKAWAYQDSYAEYNDGSPNLSWVLKDKDGNPLYIPWGKQNADGSYSQYAADPGSPAWRQAYSDRVKAAAAKGYGLYADDVNLDHVTVSGTPIDPRTGQVMTLTAWDQYFAEFMEKVRADNPDIEIVHNSLWWAGNDGQSASVQRQIKAATAISLERGFNDSNYDPGQFIRLFAYIDRIHSWGVGAYHLSYASDVASATFNLACALLCSNGMDFVSSPWQLMQPNGYQAMFDTNLGRAKGPRYQTGTYTWARDFELGSVSVALDKKTGVIS